MASTRVQFSVGLFMTAGLALATLAIIWLGMSSFLKQGELFVTYFDESVQGLNVDSPVKYRGVPVGRVKSIRIAPDYHLIEVLIVIDTENVNTKDQFADAVASLSNVGITGAMFVEIDKAGSNAIQFSPKLSFEPPYPVIASRPSNIHKLFREIDRIATKLNSIDFEAISHEALAAFRALNQSVHDAQIDAIAQDIRTFMGNINTATNPRRLESIAQNMEQTVRSSHNLVEKATTEMQTMHEILTSFRAMLESNRPYVDTTLSSLASAAVKADGVMEQSRVTAHQMQTSIQEVEERLSVTAENLEQTSRNLDMLIESLQDQPSKLLFATPKPPRLVEE